MFDKSNKSDFNEMIETYNCIYKFSNTDSLHSFLNEKLHKEGE